MADVQLTEEQINKLLYEKLSPEEVSNLTQKEKDILVDAIRGVSLGDYTLYNDLKYAEYQEIPVDILTFIDDYNYLGASWHNGAGNSTLYPYWRNRLVELFPDNLSTNYNTAIFSGSRGLGKMLPDSSIVLSENGFIKNGDLKPGMKIYSRDGKLCTVLNTFHHKNKGLYKIIFSDGTGTKCGLEHLWQVSHREDNKEIMEVLTTKQLLKRDIIGQHDEYLYSIPLCNPIDFPSKNIDNIYEKGCHIAEVEEKIDVQYLYNDIDSRINLLHGLLDTKGKISVGRVQYSTTSTELADNIAWLVQSLGGVADIQYYHNDSGKQITVYIVLPKNILPFSDEEKLENYVYTKPKRYIAEIIKLNQREDCTCIYVDNPEHLYITNDFIITHNTEIAVTVMCYLMYRLMCLKNPLEYYGLKTSDTIVFAFMNIKLDLTRSIGVTKFQNAVMMSPWFMSHGTVVQQAKFKWRPPDYIHLVIGSQADDLIGLPVQVAFFDEISFLRNMDIEQQKEKAKNMVSTAIGGMKTRFIKNGKNHSMLILASSKRSDESFLETYIRNELLTETDNLFLVDEAVWNVKPKGTYSNKTFKIGVGNKFLASTIIDDNDNINTYIDKGYKIINVPIDFKPDFVSDMDRSLCDFAGISSTELSKYISGEAWAETRDDRLKNPFVQEIIEVGDGDSGQYANFFDMNRVDRRMMNRPLYVHLDMSTAGDCTGIAGVWIKSKQASNGDRDASDDLKFQLAFAVSVKAPKGRHLSFEKNRRFIYWLRDVGFKVKGVSTDSFQSVDFGQQISARGFQYKMISVDRTEKVKDTYICKPYQYFRNCIYEHRLITFYDEKLTNEIIDLERNINNGKVDHPIGGAKDISDSLCGAIYNASQNAEQFGYNYGEDMETAVNVNMSSSANNVREQVTIDFADILTQIGMPESIKQMHDEDAANKDEEENTRSGWSPTTVRNGNIMIW